MLKSKLWFFLTIIKQEKLYFRLGIAFALIIISILANTLIPVFLKYFIDEVSSIEKSTSANTVFLLLAYGIIWIVAHISVQFRQITVLKPLERIVNIFSLKLFTHLHSLPNEFHHSKNIGAITGILAKATDSISILFYGLLFFIIPTIIEILSATFILWYFYSYLYGLILVTVAIIFIVFTFIFTFKIEKYQNISNEFHFETNACMADSILNFMNVKYFNNTNHEIKKYQLCLDQREKSLTRFLTYSEYVRLGQGMIIGFGLIIMTFIAGKNILSGVYKVSDFILINGYILQFITPLNFFGMIIQNIRRSLKNLENAFNILDTTPLIIQGDNLKTIKKINFIEFKKVAFGYNLSNLILKNINFKISKGCTLAIVGKTGSGKSTISNLLFKFYNVDSGKILLNGININQLQFNNLCELITIIPQDINLFNTSIYENIRYGNINASANEVERVIQLCQLQQFIEQLPDSYNTKVGERGLKLSVGERQRIAIARGLLKPASLYILDEATSSLDLHTEAQIMQNIMLTTENSIRIIIAHRLSTIINADHILVIDKGTIVEQGNHLELLSNKGKYYSLWHCQADKF